MNEPHDRDTARVLLMAYALYLAVLIALGCCARRADDPTTPIVDAAARYDVAQETLAERSRTLAACRSALHIALVERARGPRIRALAGTLLFAKGEEDQARREVAEAERVLATALLAAPRGG